MGTAQKLFDDASLAYDKSITLIKGLDKVFQEAVFQDQPSRRYDTRITLAQFDMILQAIMLTQALSDGNFDRLERQFVDKITDYGDLLNFIKQQTNGELVLTWDNIAMLDRSTQQKLVKLLPSMLDKLCDNFVEPLALVDKAVEQKDFLSELVENIAHICACLAQVDGRAEKSEVLAGSQMVVDLLGSRWNRYLR